MTVSSPVGLPIGGFQKLSLVDYPGKLSAVLFTQGCPLRCRFCHNPELVERKRFQVPLPFSKILGFLEARRGLLEGVVFSGGEPLIHSQLLSYLRKVKDLGFSCKLDSSGARPDALKGALDSGLVDYVAMDLKAPLSDTSLFQGSVTPQDLERSIQLILASGVSHEFRTTVIPSFHRLEHLAAMAQSLRGAQTYRLQPFRPHKTLDPTFQAQPACSPSFLKGLLSDLHRQFPWTQTFVS